MDNLEKLSDQKQREILAAERETAALCDCSHHEKSSNPSGTMPAIPSIDAEPLEHEDKLAKAAAMEDVTRLEMQKLEIDTHIRRKAH